MALMAFASASVARLTRTVLVLANRPVAGAVGRPSSGRVRAAYRRLAAGAATVAAGSMMDRAPVRASRRAQLATSSSSVR